MELARSSLADWWGCRVRRRVGPAVLVIAVLLGIGAGGAAACVPQPKLVVLHPQSSGPAGAQVTVEVVGLDPGPAEVRWNGIDGELLAQATGPDFSVPVEIPEAEDGLYNVVVLSRHPSGALGNTAVVSFLVDSSSGAAAPRQWSTSTTAATSGRPPAARPAGLSTGAGVALAAAFLAVGMMATAYLARRRPLQ